MLALTLSLIVVLAAAGEAPPVPPRYIQPRVQFDGVEKYPRHTFFLKYRTSNGNPFGAPALYVEVKNSDPITLEAKRLLSGVDLFAVDAEEAVRLREQDPSLKWLNHMTPGLLRVRLTAPSTVSSSKEREAPVTKYKVAIKGGKLVVEGPPAEKKNEKRSDR
jgi:hypothetical protein